MKISSSSFNFFPLCNPVFILKPPKPCSDCIAPCHRCTECFLPTCSPTFLPCSACGNKYYCKSHSRTCAACDQSFCLAHSLICRSCGDVSCFKHGKLCNGCVETYCSHHIQTSKISTPSYQVSMHNPTPNALHPVFCWRQRNKLYENGVEDARTYCSEDPELNKELKHIADCFLRHKNIEEINFTRLLQRKSFALDEERQQEKRWFYDQLENDKTEAKRQNMEDTQNRKRKWDELEQMGTDLAQDKQQFDKEKVDMLSKYIIKSPVKLNVGGIYFETSTTTLTKFPSMLASMFSGRYPLEKGADGAYFIDRDGTHFRHILNFMRDADMPETLTRAEVDALRRECTYYLLDAMLIELSTYQKRDDKKK